MKFKINYRRLNMSSNIYIKLFNESIGHCEQIETNNGNEYGMHDYDHEYLHISFKEFYANENLFEILQISSNHAFPARVGSPPPNFIFAILNPLAFASINIFCRKISAS